MSNAGGGRSLERARGPDPMIMAVVSGEQVAPLSWPCPQLSPHPVTPNAGAETLRWTPIAPGDVRRVLAYTCSCRSTVFELCSLGGRLVVRRTVRHLGTTDYAGPWSRREGEALWLRLLTGQAK